MIQCILQCLPFNVFLYSLINLQSFSKWIPLYIFTMLQFSNTHPFTFIVLLSCVGYFSSSCSLTAALPLNTSIVVPTSIQQCSYIDTKLQWIRFILVKFILPSNIDGKLLMELKILLTLMFIKAYFHLLNLMLNPFLLHFVFPLGLSLTWRKKSLVLLPFQGLSQQSQKTGGRDNIYLPCQGLSYGISSFFFCLPLRICL